MRTAGVVGLLLGAGCGQRVGEAAGAGGKADGPSDNVWCAIVSVSG